MRGGHASPVSDDPVRACLQENHICNKLDGLVYSDTAVYGRKIQQNRGRGMVGP